MKRPTRILLWAFVAHVLISCGPIGAGAPDDPRSGRLYFGWASTSITPDRPVAVGGQYHTRISGEVHDPLLATALALETRDETGVIDQAVFVSCDLAVIRRQVQEKMREQVQNIE